MALNFENFDKRDCTIITKAVKSGDPRNVEKVISGLKDLKEDITTNLHTTDRQGYTAIHHAVLQADPSVLQQLLVYADNRCIDTESHDRTTALLLLCQQDCHSPQEEMLASLLAAGANPNMLSPDPFSLPLLCALERKWWRGAELLLEAGADPWMTDFEHCGWVPLYFAMDQPDIFKLILKKGEYVSHPLHKLFESLVEWIPDEEMMELYTRILSCYPLEVDVSLLLRASEKPYLDIVIHMLPALPALPCCDMVRSEEFVREFLRMMFPTLTELSPVDLRNQDSLKILLEEAELSGQPATGWEMKFVDVAQLSRLLLDCYRGLPPRESVSYDLLGVIASAVSAVDALKSNVSMLLQAGFKSSMYTLAAYIEHSVSRPVHTERRRPHARLLSELSRHCCSTGACWLREPFIINTCKRLILCQDYDMDHTQSVAVLLCLGVNFRDVFCSVQASREGSGSNKAKLDVLNLFDPCCNATSVVITWPTPDGDRHQYDLGSLKHLSRLALRSALGLCRMEEKLRSLQHIVPASMRDYVCFKQEFPFF